MIYVFILLAINFILLAYLLFDSSKCHENFKLINERFKVSDVSSNLSTQKIDALEERFKAPTSLENYDTIIANVKEDAVDKSKDATILMVKDIQAKIDTILQIMRFTKIIKEVPVPLSPMSSELELEPKPKPNHK